MPQRADLTFSDIDVAHIKKLDLGRCCTVQLLNHLPRVRPLNLVAVASTNHCFSTRIGRRAVVLLSCDVKAAGLRLKFNPTGCGRAPHKHQLVGLQVKQNPVADYMTVVAAGSQLFRSVYGEFGETIEAEIRSQLHRIRPFDVKVGHMVGLVEQNAAVAPRALFIPPVAVLGGNHRIDISAYLRVTQEVNRVLRLEEIFQALTHKFLLSVSADVHLRQGERKRVVYHTIPGSSIGFQTSGAAAYNRKG